MQEAGFSFFASIFFFLQKKKKSEKCFGAELLGSLSDIGGMITGENRGGNQTGYIDASGNYHQRTCFVAGTKVYTKDGLKNIEEIKIGDKVLSWNPETGATELKTVTHLFVRHTDLIYKLSFSSGRSVETTWNHPFYIAGRGFVETKDLKVGDVLTTADSSPLNLTAISTDAREETVYNFEVEGNHTYFVGEDGVLVHNQSNEYNKLVPTYPQSGAIATFGQKLLNGISGNGFKSNNDLKMEQDFKDKILPVYKTESGGILALDTKINDPFGSKSDPALKRKTSTHSGIDQKTRSAEFPEGERPIGATLGGVVTVKETKLGFGKQVHIEHAPGIKTIYGHAKTTLVSNGQTVRQGQTVMISDSSGNSHGPHLHHDLQVDGKSVDPVTYPLEAEVAKRRQNQNTGNRK